MWKADAHLEWDALDLQKLQMEGHVPILRLGQLGGGVGKASDQYFDWATLDEASEADSQFFDWDVLEQQTSDR